MQISIIIPTRNRAEEVEIAIDSIFKQTSFSRINEIIIVDQSTNSKTKEVVDKLNQTLNSLPIQYVKLKKIPSLTISRNFGVKYATGDIILFLDDDVILYPDYVERLLDIYENFRDVVGVGGDVVKGESDSEIKVLKMLHELFNMINGKIFFLGRNEKNRMRILPSGSNTYPYEKLDKIIPAEWLGGCSCSYKREIFEEFKFDEKLRRWCWKEDVDFSYRVYKKYPGKLFITPYAKLIHNESEKMKLESKKKIYMIEVYTLYFFYKNILLESRSRFDSLKKYSLYAWSRVGQLFKRLVFIAVRPKKEKIIEFEYMIRALIYAFDNRDKIKKGDLEFFNKTL